MTAAATDIRTDTAHAVPYRASPRTLGRAALAALAAGAAIVVLFVMPAEYGIDPTGAGGALGLTRMSGKAAEAADDAAAPDAAPAATPLALQPQTKASIAKTTAFRTDERRITLAPHEGIELKARMQPGDALNFRWSATGPVKMDMHGEVGGTDAFTTYWKEKNLTKAQGNFTAPFAGIHGWYWRNQGEAPVTLTLNTDGFYKELFQPAK